MPISSVEDRRPAPHLAIEDLAAGYGGAFVVSEMTVGVGLGEIVALVGPNGAGKSTLLKAVAGHISVMQGKVLLGDEDITNVRSDRLARKGVGYVPQTNDVFDTLTVADNLEMGGYLLPRRLVADRVDEVLTIFPKLRTMMDRTAQKLSGGERKMVAIARVLMLRPSLLILDEPTSNLSIELSRVVLREQVVRLADAGVAVLLVEQKAIEALEIAHWACVMVAGQTRLSAPAKDVLQRPDIGEIFLGRATTDVRTGGRGSA
jgi:ABC-type branched-subunit amino acid transport system ATPase component